jgi:hypothetical protein
MSESRANLEQILELLLAEDNARAEEMLHEYVVAKARAEYERVLDEAEDMEFEEDIDQSNDFEDDILNDEEEILADETGLEEDEEMSDDEMSDDEMSDDNDEDEDGDDLEGKVEELSDELEKLRAEFEKMMSDKDMDDAESLDMDSMDDAEGEMESVEYDLDEDFDEDFEVVEEATKLQDNVSSLKDPNTDSSNQKSPVAKHKSGWETGSPVKSKDGSHGNMGENKPKDHTPTSNIKVTPKKV